MDTDAADVRNCRHGTACWNCGHCEGCRRELHDPRDAVVEAVGEMLYDLKRLAQGVVKRAPTQRPDDNTNILAYNVWVRLDGAYRNAKMVEQQIRELDRAHEERQP